MYMYVPSKYYVSFQNRGEDSLLGFFTPDDGDANSKKRKQNVDNWGDSKLKSASFDNTPKTGFRIVDTARRYRSNNVLFRVIHPEVGAEFEISAENLNVLHQQCIIEYGEIKTELLFVRKGKDNVLVVNDSEEHKNAIQEMEKEEEKKAAIKAITKKDLKVGMEIKLASSYGTHTYLGKHTISFFSRDKDRNGYYNAKSSISGYTIHNLEDEYFIFCSKDTDERYHLQVRKSFPKIEKIIKDDTGITYKDVENGKMGDIWGLKDSVTGIVGIQFNSEIKADDYEYIAIPAPKVVVGSPDIDSHFYSYGTIFFEVSPGTYGIASLDSGWTNKVYNRIVKYTHTFTMNNMNINIKSITSNPYYGTEVTDPTTKFYHLGIKKK